MTMQWNFCVYVNNEYYMYLCIIHKKVIVFRRKLHSDKSKQNDSCFTLSHLKWYPLVYVISEKQYKILLHASSLLCIFHSGRNSKGIYIVEMMTVLYINCILCVEYFYQKLSDKHHPYH